MRKYLTSNLSIAIPSIIFIAICMASVTWLKHSWETNEIDDSQYLEILLNINTHFNDNIKLHLIKSANDGKIVMYEYKEFMLLAQASEIKPLRAKDAKARLLELFSLHYYQKN